MVTGLADGGFVAMWRSLGQDGDVDGVYGQRFDASGNAIGGEFQVNTTTGGKQYFPQVASLADGGFMAAWSTAGQGDSDYKVFAQRFDAVGSKVGAEFQVNDNSYTTQYAHQNYPGIAIQPDGSMIVTWDSSSQDGNAYGVYAKAYSVSEEGTFVTGSSMNDVLNGTADNDVITGGAGDDIIDGDTGNDLIEGGSGNDTMTGGLGDDAYTLARGDEQDIINNVGEGASTDTIDYAASINYDQLWFAQSGNDLVISVIGATDQATVSDWYVGGTANHVSTITTSDGYYLNNSAVQNLVDAMASMVPPPCWSD